MSKRVRVTLGHRQAALLWAAAVRGIDELTAEEDLEPEDYRLGLRADDALRVLTRAILAAGYDPMEVER